MILIADSGSTKTSWCLLKQGEEPLKFNSEGYNPYYVGADYIEQSVRASLPELVSATEINEVYFYGAGCSADKSPVVVEALKKVFVNAGIVEVESDLLAAAKSVLGDSEGFVGILGTGTNSCIYDGKKITDQVDSLGFILGDEGSGAYLGKSVLIAYVRGYMPADLKSKFDKEFNLSSAEIISKIYTEPLPNRFSATFSKFVGDNIDHLFIQQLVKKSFRDFFTNIVSYYPHFSKYSFNCVGSVAYTYLPYLEEVASEFNMSIGQIIRNPLSGLVKYHDRQCC
ncbi:N-acetylglucosamine kinase [Pseudopedobacter saltans DSM 12145]|uniref:N-acetylglucosamine kinase n=1 Tax=Pseudopedobacter saltans (strain ATCC 51119 / DSM 12145 / JCM 21818 / CCUG 39354 / LMG 10337 / NBRC 100064 / NCIMB 13643) TaxID=762903 RepID=F0SAY8_PSESL|nr:N-acetylglucosamine kinase [Pseudopedobacter saltans]ADY51583.1 N-acetylglucosamine kinase [Pseudopedobacter saltans DSM 12145]